MRERPDDRGGEVVPFPAGSRHPSQWPPDARGGYCFYCDAPAEEDPCPECGRPLWQPEGSEEGREEERPLFEELPPGDGGVIEEGEEQPRGKEDQEDRPRPFDYEDVEDFTSEEYMKATTEEYRGLAEEIARASEQHYEPQAVAAAIPGLESGVVGFEDVIGEPYREEPAEASDLALRVGTALVLAALFLGALWAGAAWLAGLITVIGVVALGEFYATLRRSGYVPAALFGLLGAVAVVPAAWLAGAAGIAGLVLATLVVLLVWYALGLVQRDPLENASLTLLGVVWIPALLAFAVPILQARNARLLVLAVVLVTVAEDTGSYFVGRAWGRTRLAPHLSPRKTVEGLVGGILAALAVGAGLGLLEFMGGPARGLLLGAVVGGVAPVGDLAESAMKRALGVKDMGSVLPGHGGLLDRIDGLLFVIPAAYLLYRLLGLVG